MTFRKQNDYEWNRIAWPIPDLNWTSGPRGQRRLVTESRKTYWRACCGSCRPVIHGARCHPLTVRASVTGPFIRSATSTSCMRLSKYCVMRCQCPDADLRRIGADPRIEPIGTARRPQAELFRLRQSPSLTFAPREIADVKQANGRLKIRLLGLGMFGPNGPLPIHVTEIAREREREQNRRDATFVHGSPGNSGTVNIGSGTREISGIATGAHFVEQQDRQSHYRLKLQPWIWLADQRSD